MREIDYVIRCETSACANRLPGNMFDGRSEVTHIYIYIYKYKIYIPIYNCSLRHHFATEMPG